MDQNTGEIMSNGSISQRAARPASDAHVTLQNQRNAYGALPLHQAIEYALKKINPIIGHDEKGHNSRYTSLKKLIETVQPVLLDAGIRIRQGAERSYSADEGGGAKTRMVPVYTDLVHMGTGEFERTTIEVPIARLDPQSMGSAITYGKRYSLVAALGLAPTDKADDDGAGAMPRDLGATIEQSKDLTAMLADIAKVKEATELVSWKLEKKNAKRFNKLSDDEAAVFKAAYQKHERDLVDGGPQ